MCGRYASARSRNQLMEAFKIEEPHAAEVSRQDYNLAPTKKAPAVLATSPVDADPVRELRLLRWGLIPSWAKDGKKGINNARAETVHEKPTFKKAFAGRRCLLPVDGFYEWFQVDGEKQPFFLRPNDGSVLALAGIYELWKDSEEESDLRFTLITTQASDAMGHVHDRMPMVIDAQNWDTWLDPRMSNVEQAHGLMVPAHDLEVYQVAKLVNAVRNNGPDLIQPLT